VEKVAGEAGGEEGCSNGGDEDEEDGWKSERRGAEEEEARRMPRRAIAKAIKDKLNDLCAAIAIGNTASLNRQG
jgi:hypothetical protein